MYLTIQFKLRKKHKASNTARLATYLNFPATTKAAFKFYNQVFNGKYTGVKLNGSRDIEMPVEMPPMSEQTKKLIIQPELIIYGRSYTNGNGLS